MAFFTLLREGSAGNRPMAYSLMRAGAVPAGTIWELILWIVSQLVL